ncbi:MAG: protein-L-isoaspartate O-methyltransferase [Alphaproteobacteria bacterium]|nr:protein-L-isoaspartate O-methyltransferase [Alphaproteobacteria bacterium]
MDVSASDFAEARERMVDGQIRPNRVSDPRVLQAMREIPRERFLPPRLAPFAYIDDHVALGNGRVLMEPLAFARLAQLAQIRPGMRTLVVGAGTGYGAAVLVACGAAVTALEQDTALLDIARPALAACAASVALVAGTLASGWPAGAPWDLVFIEGAVPGVPAALGEQLRPDSGRLVGVLAGGGRPGNAILGERTAAGLTIRPMFDCATPVLPQLVPKSEFVF